MKKVTYLDNGTVMETTIYDLVKWYIDRYECLQVDLPGKESFASFINFELPLEEYDDAEMFLEEFVDMSVPSEPGEDPAEHEKIKKLVQDFLEDC